jgi:hypothetical protein
LGQLLPAAIARGIGRNAPIPVVREAAPQRGRPPKPVLYFPVRPDRRSIKIGAKVVSHGRYVIFQMAEVAVSRQMFADILSLIARLRVPPAPA